MARGRCRLSATQSAFRIKLLHPAMEPMEGCAVLLGRDQGSVPCEEYQLHCHGDNGAELFLALCAGRQHALNLRGPEDKTCIEIFSLV